MHTHLAAFFTLLAHLNVKESLGKSSSTASQQKKNIFTPTPWRPIQKHKLPPIGGIIQGEINNVHWGVSQLALRRALSADSCRSHHDGILNLPFVSCRICGANAGLPLPAVSKARSPGFVQCMPLLVHTCMIPFRTQHKHIRSAITRRKQSL